MSLERRIAKLEEQPFQGSLQDSVEARVNAGTGTISDYATFYADDIAKKQDEFLATTPYLLAMTHSGLRHRSTPDFALAYPPDRSIPPEIQEPFDECVESHEVDVEELLSQGKSNRTTEERRWTCANLRAGYACLLLACGGFDGLALRRRIWAVEDGRWVLIPEVWQAATRKSRSLHVTHPRFEVPGIEAAWQAGQIGDPNDRYALVTFAEAAHFVGVPTVPVLDETVVKSGQQQSTMPPRPWPDSLPELEVSTSIAGLPRGIAPGETP